MVFQTNVRPTTGNRRPAVLIGNQLVPTINRGMDAATIVLGNSLLRAADGAIDIGPNAAPGADQVDVEGHGRQGHATGVQDLVGLLGR